MPAEDSKGGLRVSGRHHHWQKFKTGHDGVKLKQCIVKYIPLCCQLALRLILKSLIAGN